MTRSSKKREKIKPLPCQTLLNILLDYDSETGKLIWKSRGRAFFSTLRGYRIWNAQHCGNEALNYKSPFGYQCGKIFNIRYYTHRIIWKMVNGNDPIVIDHIDRDRCNNKLANLREVSFSGNNRNMKIPSHNSSGHVGVSWLERSNAWRAEIQADGKAYHLGLFADISDAIIARKDAEKNLGFHPNHGREAQQ